jgi:hypothetical protein
MSVSLINAGAENYVNYERNTLEPFRYPVFLRRIKNAYISVINNNLIEGFQRKITCL